MYGIFCVRVFDSPASFLELTMETRPDDIARTVASLRSVEGILKEPPRRRRLPFSLWPAGLPEGALTNFFGSSGSGKTEAALRFARETFQVWPGRLAWVEPSLTAYPPAFAQLGMDLSDILFIQAKERLVWSAQQVIRSQLFPLCALAIGKQEPAERDLRRLQLETERCGITLLLISEKPMRSFSIRLRLSVSRDWGQLILNEADRAVERAG